MQDKRKRHRRQYMFTVEYYFPIYTASISSIQLLRQFDSGTDILLHDLYQFTG